MSCKSRTASYLALGRIWYDTGTRRDIHPLTPETCCGSVIILDFMRYGEDNKRQVHQQSGWKPPHPDHWCPHLHYLPNFTQDAFPAATVQFILT